ncbi:phosphoribosylformylglycinamidine synthase subunit PurL [Apilactobacillus timberlakei]|uniref:Phosphoribosylformylglycinamidine synthase subunit PurL n=1 Tax=Apilactobacillus timberlakei TaxID=2008380 RepID=A0ABY2YUV6_9LACO|nr:phosphoribosylformylglycinamidine synthase subunit PurL [Apilactobacillus timberlakei]TPR13921.1 phosphoribosylformylglycinamidine synthase subunit PurL [Apilactobacillus timberlakei]TPR15236.1 phosphoribosylformylglycinamidine synthase subunit PurL [Apilactobacillus timberlakei]TPR17127.1 phosphoribosylformylglycinamidine synthase subunit PurL [Apilactobacillus timberlakei]
MLKKHIEPSAEEIRDQKLYVQMGLTEKEYKIIVDKLIHRLPNYTEIGLFSGMWSEHCSYKNSKSILIKFWSDGSRVLQGPGEGAGVLDIDDGQAVVFKAESHNHPSFVEPYEGAATGVGGIIRDIFSMGAKPIASLDSLRFGDLDSQKNRFLLSQVVSGIANYGNCIGIPTVGGEIGFDDTYNGNPLVNVMCVGLMNKKDMETGRSKGLGNSIIYVGAKTGRDGINGATFASSEFSEKEEAERSAVQVGDPFMEKLLVDACLEITKYHSDILVGIQDMGAAGIVSSSAEMAAKANSGVDLNLDLVPKRESGMTPYEMMLSESQERMLLCVKKGYEDEVINIFKKYKLEAKVIGKVNDDGQYRLSFQDEIVCDIPTKSLVDDVPEYSHPVIKPKRLLKKINDYYPAFDDTYQILKELLSQPTIASKNSIYRQYDSRVQANTVLSPGSDAAIVRIRHTNKSLAMTTDCNSRYIYLNPYIGGQIAVAEAARNIVASGGHPIGITDCLNFGNPDDSDSYYSMDQSVEGMSEACKKFDTPVIGGNVSLYNETDGNSIYPTPMVGMVGLIENNSNVMDQHAKKANDLVYVIGQTYDDFNGSELQKMLNKKISGDIKHFDLNEEYDNQKLVQNIIKQGLVNSVHDVSEGGLAVALMESLFKNKLGFNGGMDISKEQLFSESQSRFIVTIDPINRDKFEKITGLKATMIGYTTKDNKINMQLSNGKLTGEMINLRKAWEDSLACYMK